jgi:hypothetical protein
LHARAARGRQDRRLARISAAIDLQPVQDIT